MALVNIIISYFHKLYAIFALSKVIAKKGYKKGEPSLSFGLIPVTVASAATAVFVPLLLSCSSAVRASLGLVFESFFLVESLLAFVKNKFGVAIFASNNLISHVYIPPTIIWIYLNFPLQMIESELYRE